MSHRIDKIDLQMARAQANRYGTRGDSDLESAAMRGLLEASRTYTATKGTWRGYSHMKIKSRIANELHRKAHSREILMTTEDLTELDTTVDDHADRIVTLDVLPTTVATDFASGHIDLRRMDHRQAIELLKDGLT